MLLLHLERESLLEDAPLAWSDLRRHLECASKGDPLAMTVHGIERRAVGGLSERHASRRGAFVRVRAWAFRCDVGSRETALSDAVGVWLSTGYCGIERLRKRCGSYTALARPWISRHLAIKESNGSSSSSNTNASAIRV